MRASVVLVTIAVVLGITFGSGCNRSSDKRAAMSPRQADDLFSRLDRNTVMSYCGDDKPLPSNAKSRTKNPNLLDYPFGYFIFEDGGSVLMEAGMQITGEADKTIWTNVHRDSTEQNKDLRVGHALSVSSAEMLAMLKEISVYEYEGQTALKILQANIPGGNCLAGLATRY